MDDIIHDTLTAYICLRRQIMRLSHLLKQFTLSVFNNIILINYIQELYKIYRLFNT
jgi:hypothetical protein